MPLPPPAIKCQQLGVTTNDVLGGSIEPTLGMHHIVSNVQRVCIFRYFKEAPLFENELPRSACCSLKINSHNKKSNCLHVITHFWYTHVIAHVLAQSSLQCTVMVIIVSCWQTYIHIFCDTNFSFFEIHWKYIMNTNFA